MVGNQIEHCSATSADTNTAIVGILIKQNKGTTVMILPRMPQKPSQNNDVAKAHDLQRHTHDIACDSHGIEDEIRAMVSSYMVPNDDEDQELAIGRLVC